MVASPHERRRAKRCGGTFLFAKGHQLPAELLRINAHSPERHILRYAAEFLTRGRVLGIPTDTVYGLAADPYNLSAVEEIYRVKGRPETRALPILVNSIEQAILLAREIPDNFLRLATAFWPGALTIVLDAGHRLPLKVTANTGRVALRFPRSPVVAALIDEFGGPITGTSANLSGHPSCSSGAQVHEQLGSRLSLILDVGELDASLASTIVVLRGDETWKIVREGVIPNSDIESHLS
jgi:tRNA threonylcarbamoyl adenosine modification protein (Sua5/YciO/YrdC/YwlC family)